MKKIGLILILLPLTTIAQANEIKTEVKEPISTAQKEMPFSIGIVYDGQTEENGGEDIELSGMNVQFSVDFKINEKLITTTQVSTNNLDGSASYSEYDKDSSYSGFNIYQKLTSKINYFKYPIKPFIGIGFGTGQYNSENSIKKSNLREELGIKSFDISAEYNTSHTVLGIEIPLKNRLTPYFSYMFSRTSYDDPSVNFKRSSSSYDRVESDADIESTTSSRYTVGMNYIF